MKSMLKAFCVCSLLFFSLTAENCSDGKQPTINETNGEYVCLPCGSDCDNAVYTKPGTCKHCDMKLVQKSTVVFKKVEPELLCSFIDSVGEKNILLLDVRTPEEFEGRAVDKFGSLRNAMNIPVQELEKRVSELEKYKDREVVVYCSHSHRSPRASYMLTQNGFKHVTNMQEGMSVWKERVKDKACNQQLYVQQ